MEVKNYRIEKLQKAIELTTPLEDWDKNTCTTNFSKGINLFNQLCLASNLKPDAKLDIYVEYAKRVPDEAQDMLNRWRDSLPFMKGQELNDLIILLCKISGSSDVSSHERMITAMCLYNNCYLDVCYRCFEDIACDRSALVNYRVDAARYLYGTQLDEYKSSAQDTLIEIIESTEYQSDYRYKIIAGFISRTGLCTMLNSTKLKVPYDEEFVYSLQHVFFYNYKNDARDRILSGQYLLQINLTTDDEKVDIGFKLLDIALDINISSVIRADAADVVLRYGTIEQKLKARDVITNLGYSTVDSNSNGTLIERSRTIYTDSENVHEFSEQVDKFIEKMFMDSTVRVKPFHIVHNEVTDYLRNVIQEKDRRFQAFKALNRISIDSARFTSLKVTLAEIFVHVWSYILRYDEEKREDLKLRLVQELIDMGDTCSSGHSSRFVNVLSVYETSLRISFSEQIKTNMIGRMAAKIRDCPDLDIASKLAVAESDLAEKDDIIAYNKFISDNTETIRKELYAEFVDCGYVTAEEFDEAFKNGSKTWLLKEQ